MVANLGEEVGNRQAAGSTWPELAEGGGEITDLPAAGIDEFLVGGEALAGVFFKSGLGVEGVDLAGTAVHHQKDDALGLGREVRRPGAERVPRRFGIGGFSLLTKKAIGFEQRGERQAGESRPHLPDEFAAGLAARKLTVSGAGRHWSSPRDSVDKKEFVGVHQDLAERRERER